MVYPKHVWKLFLCSKYLSVFMFHVFMYECIYVYVHLNVCEAVLMLAVIQTEFSLLYWSGQSNFFEKSNRHSRTAYLHFTLLHILCNIYHSLFEQTVFFSFATNDGEYVRILENPIFTIERNQNLTLFTLVKYAEKGKKIQHVLPSNFDDDTFCISFRN